MDQHPIVLFDGICNFCNYWVKFAIKRDPKRQLRFAPLQGETAKRLLRENGITISALSSVILIDNGKVYTQSSAALRMYKYLGGGWKLFYGFIVVPKFIRDFFYNIIARNRYQWFGKKETCMVPPPDWKERFFE